VKTLGGEGVATHPGPEPCVIVRKHGCDASAGERIGRRLSRERNLSRVPDAVVRVQGNTHVHDNASARTAWRGRRPWHVRTLLVREPEDPTSGRHLWGGPRREGEELQPMMHGRGSRTTP
jgi:hypothetical protein